jgi:hypothetical protein
MMLKKSKKETEIPAEKAARIAEKGLKSVRLSKSEKSALARSGLKEIYSIQEGLNGPIPKLDERLMDKIMEKHFPRTQIISTESPMDIILRLTENTIAVIRNAIDWNPLSPAFAVRGAESGGISFYKEAGKLTIHLEVIKTDNRRVSLNVRVTDETKRDRTSFEATLFKGDRCIESMSVTESPVISFSNITLDNYLLKVSDKKGEITSVVIRMEQ